MDQRFRTDLVDEIVQGGIKFWRAVNASGSILLDSFRMERANANTREGSAFGAKEANAIHAFLNGALDGTETVNKATNSTNASNAPDGFNIGSPEDPKKVAQWWLGANLKISMYGSETGFSIQLKKANGELIHTLLSADKDGISLVDNSRELGGQPSSYYAKQTDINNIKNGVTKVGDSAKLGDQSPSYYALASQFQDITRIRRYQVTTNPGGKNYIDIARNSNEFIIPLSLTGVSNVIEKMQYSGVSVRIVLDGNVTGNLLFYYMIVYI